MPHDRLFHDVLFIAIGLSWIVFALRRERWSGDPATIGRMPTLKQRRARIIGVLLGVLNIFIALMDIVHTPGH
jgi:hypothetical protein